MPSVSLRYALTLFALNAYVSIRVFGLEYSHRMDSSAGNRHTKNYGC